MPKTPAVIIRKGYPMIETGSGEFRHIDPETDGDIIKELELRLPQESMDLLLPPKGATPTELLFPRFILKNFASSGERAQEFIRALPGEWNIRKLGPGDWDFAVSKDGDRWHLFDPGFGAPAVEEGGSILDLPGRVAAETAMDLLDLTTDALIGVGSTAAFVAGAGAGAPTGAGAIATGSLAAGAAAGGLEGVKQILGQFMGIEDNIEITDAMAMGAITAIFSAGGPVVAKTIRSVAGKVKKVATKSRREAVTETLAEMSAGLTGVGSSPPLRPAEILKRRIKDKAGIFAQIPGIDKTAKAARRMVKSTSAREIPEQRIAQEMENQAAEAGVTVNVRQLVDEILDPLTGSIEQDALGEAITSTGDDVLELIAEGGKVAARRVPKTKELFFNDTATTESISSLVGKQIDEIMDVITLDGSESSAVPINTAVEIKRMIQNKMKDRKAIRGAVEFKGKAGGGELSEFDKVLVRFQAIFRKEIAEIMDNSGLVEAEGIGRNYSEVMVDFAKTSKQLARWKRFLGVDLPDEKGIEVAANFLRNLHKTGRVGFRDTARVFRASTGVDMIERAERAMTSELFGKAGRAKRFPRISAIGDPAGVGITKKAVNIATGPLAMVGAAGVGGFLTGGAPGALLALGGAGVLASEAGTLALARGAPRLGRFAVRQGARATDTIGAATTTRNLTVMQSLARQLIQEGQTVTSGQESVDKRLAERNRQAQQAP
jgi:hypothetical protein